MDTVVGLADSQPCIRGYRFSVEQIHGEYPFIERADVSQALGYAAALAHREVYLPLRKPA